MQREIRWPALVLGVVTAVLSAVVASYTEIILSASPLANDHSAPIALFALVFVILFVSFPLRLVHRRWALSPAELAIVYIMALASAAVCVRGFVQFVAPVITGAQYYSSVEPRWASLILPHVRKVSWLLPNGDTALRHFYEGLPAGQGVPWAAWVEPILWWLTFCLALAYVMLCVVVILRRRWMENERLVYPLVQAPIDFIRSESRDEKTPVLRSGLFWLGALLPAVHLSLEGINHYFPGYAPGVPQPYFWIFGHSVHIRFRISAFTMGLLYFVRRDVLMGLWVYPLLVLVTSGYFKYAGIRFTEHRLGIWSHRTDLAWIGAGVLLVYAAHFLYTGRRHILRTIAAAFGRGQGSDDSGEIMSYRSAVFGLILGGLFLTGWLCATGMALWQAVFYLIIAFLIYTTLTRVIVETGLPVAQPSILASDFVVGTMGTQALSNQNLVAFGFTYPFHSEMRAFSMAHEAHALKIAHETIAGRRRFLVWLILVGTALGFLAGIVLSVYYPYRDGAINLDRFTYQTNAKYCWNDALNFIQEPRGPSWIGMLLMLAGGLLMGSNLYALRLFPGFPLHPAGMVVSFNWAGWVLWFPAFCVWVLKGAFLQLGGPSFYNRAKRFFIGMIVGEVLTAVTWAAVDFAAGTHNNMVTKFF